LARVPQDLLDRPAGYKTFQRMVILHVSISLKNGKGITRNQFPSLSDRKKKKEEARSAKTLPQRKDC
jgi:hypothetical protein